MHARIPIAGICVGAIATIMCTTWPNWDLKFKKSEGWLFGDGTYELSLPPVTGSSGGRHMFWFGDTWVWDPGFDKTATGTYPASGTESPGIPFPNHAYMINGNTFAIGSWTTDRSSPTTLAFYAREKTINTSACETGASGMWDNCPVRNLSLDTLSKDNVQAAGGWIPRNNSTDTYIWPGDAVYVENPTMNLPAGYTVGPPLTSSSDKFLAMMYVRPTSGRWGFNLVTNIEASFTSWTYKGTVEFAPGASSSSWTAPVWGAAMIHVAGDDKVRIYGKIQNKVFPQINAVLAVAWPSLDLVKPDKWWYLYKAGQQGCGSTACFKQIQPTTAAAVDGLQFVATDVFNDFSVDYVCHNEPGQNGNASVNACSFILTHGAWYVAGGTPPAPDSSCAAVDNFYNARWLVNRTTADDTHFPPLQRGSYSSTQSTEIRDALVESTWDRTVLCGSPNNVRKVRQVRGQDGISEEGSLYVSWYIGSDCAGQCTPTIQEHLWDTGVSTSSRIEGGSSASTNDRRANSRFGKVPLSTMKPWCSAIGTAPKPGDPGCP